VKRRRDDFDHIVFTVCATLAGLLVGMGIGAYTEHNRKPAPTVCLAELEDGRRLLSYHLTDAGQERCLYEPPRPLKGKKR